MKKILGLFLFLTLAVVVTACGEKEKTGTGYGLVHKNYVGEVKVSQKGKKITNVEVEEYFLLSSVGTLAASDSYDVTETGNVVKINTEKDATKDAKYKYYAKYILVDNKLFTGSEKENDIQYLNSDNKEIKDIVKEQDAAKNYAEAAKNGKVFIVDNATATTKSTTLTLTGDVAKSFQKSKTEYWKEGGHGLGWKKNIEHFVASMKETGIDVTFTKKDSKWVAGDHTSSATIVDFLDYHAVAKLALANIK